MKKTNFTIAFLFAGFGLFAQIGTWTAKTGISTARSTCVGFSLDGKGYVCAGAATSTTDLKDLWQYDPSTNAWSQKADFPGDERRELAAFTVGNYAYVGNGRNVSSGTIYKSFYKYDPGNNSWSPIADCPSERYTSTGFSIDNMGYITCGILPGTSRYRDLYAYNPGTNSWAKKASLPDTAMERSYACVVSANHKAYLMGGFNGVSVADFYEYDPANDAWTRKPNYPGGIRNDCAGFSLYGYVFMGLGRDATTTNYKTWYYYSPATNKWKAIAGHPTDNVAGHAVFVIGDKAYTCAGNNMGGTFQTYLNEYSVSQATLSIEKSIAGSHQLQAFFVSQSNRIVAEVIPGDYKLKVYDVSGKMVFSDELLIEEAKQVGVNLTDLARGTYVAYLENAENTQSLKFVID